MKSKGIERNVHTYTALMNVCIKCSKHALALETYKLMRQDKCTPNVVTCEPARPPAARLPAACVSAGAPCSSLPSRHLPAAPPHPPPPPDNTLIDVYGKMGSWEEAVNVLALMKSEGVEPVLRTFK